MNKNFTLVTLFLLSLLLTGFNSSITAQTVVFSANFDDVVGTGGNSGGWDGSAASIGLSEYPGWTLTKASKGDKCLKLGTGSALGIAESPALSGLSGDATLTFKAGAWVNDSEQTELLLEISGGGALDKSSVVMEKGSFTSYTVQIIGGTPNTKITFKGKQASKARFFLDDVVVTASSTSQPSLAVEEGLTFSFSSTLGANDAQTITVKGTQLTENVTLALSGTHAALFSLDKATLGAEGGAVVITYAPTTGGAHSAVLTLTSGTATATVALSGTGIDANNPYNLDDSNPANTVSADFEGSTLPTDWTTVAVQGSRVWEMKNFDGNNWYAQMTSFGAGEANQALLISPAIDFDALVNKAISFDWKAGHATPGAKLNVYIIDKSGSSRALLLRSTDADQTPVLTIDATEPANDFAEEFTTETINVSSYTGVGFIAFEYVGDAVAGLTTTYQIDNVRDVVSTSIEDNSTESSSVSYDNNTLVVNAEIGTLVSVYNVSGKLVSSFKMSETTVSKTLESDGLLLVKVGSKVFKALSK